MVRRQQAGLGAHVSRLAPSRPALVCALFFALSLFAPGGSGDGVRYLVGAHYYLWYPDNFANGYLRGALRPAQAPALGEYDSRSASIAERHIALAASHAIDFFTLDWWPNRPAQNAAIESGFLRAANIDEIRFCIFYESKDLGHSADEDDIVFDEATKDRFVSDLMTIARRYFGHPSYLRIDGRPTLVLYVTRQMRGLFPQAMREMRRAMAAEGYDPFVIGDEIFWAVVEAAEDPDAAARVTGEPQLSRIRLFDAITAYNLYAGWERHRGYGSASHFVKDSVKLYRRYRNVAGIPIVPGVIPGFNDRAVRPQLDHFVIPRRWTAGASEGSFFTEAIERIGKPLADPRLHAILITSWNEWNEDTAIEPLSPAPPTADDASGRRLLTQGYAYEGFGSAYVDIVRDLLLH
jgi:glycoprotein endo-alpha-1,2-mannosidase